MNSRDVRKYLFTTLALLNLLCWIALAGVAGLLLSRQVDLGVETLLRQGQATAAAAWQRYTTPAPYAPSVEAVAVVPVSPSATPTTGPAVPTVPSPYPTTPHQSPPSLPVASASPTSRTEPPPSAAPSRTLSVEVPTPVATSWRLQPASTVPAAGRAASATPPPTKTTTSRPTALPDVPPVAASPTQALRTVPLLLADPGFGDLSTLNAEMDRSASGRAVQIRYQEAALNRELVALLANNPSLPYRDVVVDLKRDRVVVTGKVTVLGFQVDAAVEGVVSAVDCQLQFEIESVSVASVITPGFVKAQVAEMLQDAMAWYPDDYPLCIEQIVLEETKASIYGIRR